jgi:hypothetical protein
LPINMHPQYMLIGKLPINMYYLYMLIGNLPINMYWWCMLIGKLPINMYGVLSTVICTMCDIVCDNVYT